MPFPTRPTFGPQDLAGRFLREVRRHPLPVHAHFDQSLVITWAFRPETLEPFLVEGLSLDTFTDADGTEWGFAAAAVVKVRNLRAGFLPKALGIDDTMVGYRVFCTMPTEPDPEHGRTGGKTMRGLRILGSRTTRWTLQTGANVSTRYDYGRMRSTIRQDGTRLEIELETKDHTADLRAVAHLDRSELPAESVFATPEQARRFAGPLPYTFSPDPEGIVVVKADRTAWDPRPVAVEVETASYFDTGRFAGAERRLSNAFHVADVDYGWRPGELHRTRPDARAPWSTVTVR